MPSSFTVEEMETCEARELLEVTDPARIRMGFRHPPLHHGCTLVRGKGEAGGGRRLWRAVRWIPTEGVYVKCRVSVMGGSSQEPGGLSLCGSWKRISS